MFSADARRRQTAINLISGILAMGVSLAVSFFLSPHIVKNLGEEANGFTQLANNFVSYASLITLAFNSMAGRFISVAYHQNRLEEARSYYSSVIACNLALGAALLPLSIYVVWDLNRLLVIENAGLADVQMLFACVFLNFFLSLAASVYGVAVFVKNAMYIQNLISLLQSVLNAALLLFLFSLFPPRIFYVSAAAFCLSAGTIFLRRHYQRKLMPELRFRLSDFRFSAVREMMASGIWNTVNQCGNILMTGLDLLLCDLFISPASMGLLSVAKSIPTAIINLATTLNSNFAPALTMDWARGDRDQILRQLRSNMRISSVILSICIVTFCSYAVPFYRLWMPTLDAERLALLSFLTCMAFIPWAGPQTLYNVFTATNHLKVNSVAFVSSGVLNVGLVYLCLRYTDLGVIAVAGGSSLLTIVRNLIITAPYTARLLGLKWHTFYKDVLISLGCCAIVFAAARLVRLVIVPDSWLLLIVSVAATCAAALVVDVLFVLNQEERRALLKRWSRKG